MKLVTADRVDQAEQNNRTGQATVRFQKSLKPSSGHNFPYQNKLIQHTILNLILRFIEKHKPTLCGPNSRAIILVSWSRAPLEAPVKYRR